MRQLMGLAAAAAVVLCLAAPSHAWFFHHHHFGHHTAAYGQMQMVPAAPLNLGFQLPGGFGVTTNVDLQQLIQKVLDLHTTQQAQKTPTPAPAVTLSADVKKKINDIDTAIGDKTNGFVGDLNKLTQRINNRVKNLSADDQKKQLPNTLQDIERPQATTSSGVATGTSLGGNSETIKGPNE
jgi:hypothetical protein